MITKTISIITEVGEYAGDKDKARELRINQITPVIADGGEVRLDFAGVSVATQSFVHALISELIRQYGSEILDRLVFANCNGTIQEIVRIVADYMQQSEVA